MSASTGSPRTACRTWGDGRLIILGTDGYIELRKYVDIAGRPGNRSPVPGRQQGHAARRLRGRRLPYGRQLIADILNRTETAMSQAHCFKAMELALQAQAMPRRNDVGAAMTQGQDSRRRRLRHRPLAMSSRATCPTPTSSSCWPICDLIAARLNSLADEFDVAAPHHQLRRSPGDGRPRHHRHLHPADGALPHDPGRA